MTLQASSSSSSSKSHWLCEAETASLIHLTVVLSFYSAADLITADGPSDFTPPTTWRGLKVCSGRLSPVWPAALNHQQCELIRQTHQTAFLYCALLFVSCPKLLKTAPTFECFLQVGEEPPQPLQVKVVHLPIVEELWRDVGLWRKTTQGQSEREMT